MGNKLVAVAAVALAALALGLTWQLRASRDDASRERVRAERLADALRGAGDELERSAEIAGSERAEVGRLERELRRLRRDRRSMQPCAGGPHVWLLRPAGPVGTRVRFVGDCFVSSFYDTPKEALSGYGIFLIRQLGSRHPSGECEHIVGGRPFDIDIAKGRARGYFTVGAVGGCFQHDEGSYPTQPVPYEVGIGCHACSTSTTFRVTS